MRATIESLLCLPEPEFKMMIKKISSGNPPKKFKSANKLAAAIKFLDEEYLNTFNHPGVSNAPCLFDAIKALGVPTA